MNNVFDVLGLKVYNKQKAKMDLDIFLEKLFLLMETEKKYLQKIEMRI